MYRQQRARYCAPPILLLGDLSSLIVATSMVVEFSAHKDEIYQRCAWHHSSVAYLLFLRAPPDYHPAALPYFTPVTALLHTQHPQPPLCAVTALALLRS